MDPSLSNPYQAPAAGEPLETRVVAPGEAATRGSRLAAYVIDSLIGFAVMFPLQIWGGVFKGFPYAMKQQEFPKSLLWSIAWILLWIALNGTFLAKSAQTIGKKLMGLQIVMVHDGRPASFERVVFWRFLPLMLFSQIPYFGAVIGLADTLFIFRADRRCLHDHLAGTRVVALEPQ
ncbi:MAG TPA: RDD family protein [Polyangiaceae bacterium]|nr:RDD family protein [Polyangiaceae bacterium]